MKVTTVTAAFACIVLLGGCGSTTTSRVATGTGMGAASGAVIGSFSGNAGRGALIGAGVGALGGVLVDEHQRGSFSNN
ncbi:glycine zipper family protein [Thiocapsa rosea]|uniref:OmpA family protein n=1 Tax=Thiocapsa rosea TaxID=69360 RepID=A0A495V917_9GAMM|nr:glycine zipper family protein [Thiocapsa rosea]RKT45123.1 OmpA family protein [Thiocapsa rosea]